MRSLALGAFVGLNLALMAGCGGTSSSNTPVAPQPSLAISAPADGTVVHGSPVTISVTASNVTDSSQIAVLLNGSDVTSKLSAPDSSGARTGSVQPPDINYGVNQVQVRYQDLRANSSFTYDTADSGGGGVQAVPLKLLVPIQTRVLRNNNPTVPTNWGIQVGDTTYWSTQPVNCSSGPCNQGFQVVYLNRQDLRLVSNTTYVIESLNDINGSGFGDTLSAANGTVKGCENSGCIVIIQSLYQLGYAGCWFHGISPSCAGHSGSPPADVQSEADHLTGLGASATVLYANYTSPSVAYSFIGNGGSGHPLQNSNNGGTQYERLGCSDTRYQNPPYVCDSMGSFSPSQNSPADPTKTGMISGVLVRDNYNSFTFSPSAPHVSYTFGTTIVNGVLTNVVRLNGSTTEGNGQYSMALPKSSRGGFRLLMLDRTDPAGTSCRSCSTGSKQFDQFFDIDSSLDALTSTLTNGGSGIGGNSLVFLAGMGDISHSDEDTNFSRTWENLAQAIAQVGGDTLTFRIVGDTHPAFNSDKKDDYLMVGRPVPAVYTNAMPPLRAFESGYAIRRHTLSTATSPTIVEGVLTQDRQGYYFPRVQGSSQNMVPPQVSAVASASLMLPVAWPGTATQGQQNAYAYISSQLCCGDIRISYVNLNASPENWLTQLNQLTYPVNQSGKFAQSDFNDVKAQLAVEFNYVALVHHLQSNILSLYESQQSNVALILQQAEDAVESDIFAGSTPPPITPSAWQVFTTDVFPIEEDLAGFLGPAGGAIKTALGVGTLVINSAIDRSNDASGNSQLMISLAQQKIAASNLAQYAVNQYTDSLIALGNDFNRILTDWGRLRAIGGPLASGQLQWDNTASGYFLRAFNLAARRQYYPTLMAGNSNFFITHIQYGDYQYYGSDSRNVYNGDEQCNQSDFHNGQDNHGFYSGFDYRGTAWYPGAIQSSNGAGANPGAYWWDIWALGLTPGTNDQCPDPNGYGPLPSTFGMFDPVDQNNPSALGLWKPYFFQRAGLTLIPHQNQYFGGNVP